MQTVKVELEIPVVTDQAGCVVCSINKYTYATGNEVSSRCKLLNRYLDDCGEYNGDECTLGIDISVSDMDSPDGAENTEIHRPMIAHDCPLVAALNKGE